MPSDKICKTVHQYNKESVSDTDMHKLLDIAEDYRKVKNYVYDRFGGIGSLSKIYPGYTVQNEMTASGYRETLGLPAVTSILQSLTHWQISRVNGQGQKRS